MELEFREKFNNIFGRGWHMITDKMTPLMGVLCVQ